MAITAISTPSTSLPLAATRPVWWKVSSNAANLVHLKCEVLIDGSSASYASKIIEQNPDTYFYIDVSDYVQNAIAAKIQAASSYDVATPGTAGIVNDSSRVVSVQIKLYEVTGTSAPYTTSAVAYTSGTSYCLNAVLQHTDTQSLSAYVASSSASQYLSSAPLSRSISTSESPVLYIWHSTLANVNKLAVQTYDLSGNANAVQYISTLIGATNALLRFTCGASQLTTLGVTIDSTVSKYDIWTVKSDNTQTSEKRTFILDRASYPETTILYWHNTFGVIDHYSFTGSLQKKENTEVRTYQRTLFYSFTITDRGMQAQSFRAAEVWEVGSQLLNRADIAWLREIRRSPYVWVQSGASSLVPVIVSAGDMAYYDTNMPFDQVKLQIAFANPLITQRG